jgi:RNA-dependent RNA polymerase
MLRPDTSSSESPQMWIRPSQFKIKYTNSPPDPAKLTIDILRSTYMKTPARLSPETIINLAENGVPHAVFVDLLKTSITEVIADLTTWEGPDAMFHLWYNVERAGGVFSARRAREASGEARAKGLGDRGLDGELDEDDEDEDGYKLFDIATDQRSSAWWVDQTSGCPSSLEETVMVLLDSGFTPQKCSVLREKLKHVVRAKIKSRTQQFRFEVPCSASAFVVPGPSFQTIFGFLA